MQFFFKNKKLVVDAFIYNRAIMELFPIKSAKKSIPDWWKKLPSSVMEPSQNNRMPVMRSTIKKCPGFYNLYESGFVIPLWVDVAVETKKTGECTYRNATNMNLSPSEFHHPKQFGNVFSNFIQFKFYSPWFLREKTGVNFLYQQPTWNLTNKIKDIHVLPGMLDFKYQHSSNINVLFPKIDNKFMLEAGTPLVHVLPITEKAVDIKIHEVSDEEYRKIASFSNYGFSFTNFYRKRKSIIEKS